MDEKISKKIKSNKPNKNDLFIYSTSLIFEQNITNVWYFLRDFNNETKIFDDFDNLKYINGDNTWNLGNTFSINWIGLTRLEIKCVETQNKLNKKTIKWKEKGDIGINFYKTVNLYRITYNDKTLVKVIISRTEKKNELIEINDSIKKYYSNYKFNMLLSKSKYLQNMKNDIISYQSCIINSNYKKIWEFVSDLKKMSEITPNIGTKIEYKGPRMKIGTFIKYYFEQLNITAFMRIVGIEMPKKKKTWIFRLETIGTYINSLPNYIECKVIIINENKTQLSFLHKFPYNTSEEFINYFNTNKNETLKKYKKYIESL